MARSANDWRTLFGLKKKKTLGQKIWDKKLLILSGLALAALLGFRKTTLPFLAGMASRK
jgi:hypothetical protein